jgi:hypothetical protein
MMLESAGFEVIDLGVGGYLPGAGSAVRLAKAVLV